MVWFPMVPFWAHKPLTLYIHFGIRYGQLGSSKNGSEQPSLRCTGGILLNVGWTLHIILGLEETLKFPQAVSKEPMRAKAIVWLGSNIVGLISILEFISEASTSKLRQEDGVASSGTGMLLRLSPGVLLSSLHIEDICLQTWNLACGPAHLSCLQNYMLPPDLCFLIHHCSCVRSERKLYETLST